MIKKLSAIAAILSLSFSAMAASTIAAESINFDSTGRNCTLGLNHVTKNGTRITSYVNSRQIISMDKSTIPNSEKNTAVLLLMPDNRGYILVIESDNFDKLLVTYNTCVSR